ncbi:thiosulfate dehydrogenase [Chitinophaga polysaccharea]|uniref:Thiosulfate dehydrogenase n=1 Tax=Chitinophaga polysaccharea TaxID=1293035 RepID=A0A561PCF9_9BACT|nr:c-type cytochrome [Chitinophaga polysaccharea]TWF35813.1 thiosulfate dehydrogenase [Chitinophaga polysaccharea]
MKRIPLQTRPMLHVLEIVLFAGLLFMVIYHFFYGSNGPREKQRAATLVWIAPDTATIPPTADGDLIRYGRELIVHTAVYLGPHGSVASISNGMNCQNCHLRAGTQPFGNNYGSTASTYPKYRARSGGMESVEKRVNDCFIRSLNGQALDPDSRELKAIVAYIHWLGKDIPKGHRPPGSGIRDLPYLARGADTAAGRKVFQQKCQRCHGTNGGGMMRPDDAEFLYPPLWGAKSYNTGAGIYRLSRFAGYVKYNMPFGTNYSNIQLSDEEAWDVAAFVNSQPRPVKAFPADWPDIGSKPPDHPFGPFTDTFPVSQHKYGPFNPIVLAHQGRSRFK